MIVAKGWTVQPWKHPHLNKCPHGIHLMADFRFYPHRKHEGNVLWSCVISTVHFSPCRIKQPNDWSLLWSPVSKSYYWWSASSAKEEIPVQNSKSCQIKTQKSFVDMFIKKMDLNHSHSPCEQTLWSAWFLSLGILHWQSGGVAALSFFMGVLQLTRGVSL